MQCVDKLFSMNNKFICLALMFLTPSVTFADDIDVKLIASSANICKEAWSKPLDCPNYLGTLSMQIYGQLQDAAQCPDGKTKAKEKNLLHFVDNTDFKAFCENIKRDPKDQKKSWENCKVKTLAFLTKAATEAKKNVSCK